MRIMKKKKLFNNIIQIIQAYEGDLSDDMISYTPPTTCSSMRREDGGRYPNFNFETIASKCSSDDEPLTR